jgi:hypothetical protein
MICRLLPLCGLALAACVDAGTPRVVEESQDRVVLSWFSGSDLDRRALAIAQEHCGESGRVPLVANRSDKGRAIKREYLCAAPPDETGPGVTFRAGSDGPLSSKL